MAAIVVLVAAGLFCVAVDCLIARADQAEREVSRQK